MNAHDELLAALWRGGVGLDEAWLKYAAPNQLAEHDALPRFSDALSANAPANDLQQISQQLLQGLSNSKAVVEKQLDLRERLLDQLFNSELVAIGYPTAPRPIGKLECVNPDYFDDPEIDWHRSSLIALGFKYENIRVVLYDATLAIAPALKPRIGRPTRGPEIEAAIERIAARDLTFRTQSVKSAVRQLRAELNCGEGDRGFHDKTLERYVSKHRNPK